ncbi:MAG: NHL repeat-containing protein [Solirubrobacterales bacterium]
MDFRWSGFGAPVAVIVALALGAPQASAEPPPIGQATAESDLMIYSTDGSPNALEGTPTSPPVGTSGYPVDDWTGPMPFNIGYVQHRPHVYAIFWGSDWNNHPGTREKLIGLYQWLSGSSYAQILTQYFDHNGYISNETDLTSFTDTRIVTPSQANATDIRAEIDWAIQNQPGWQSVNYENQYVVFTPPGTPVAPGACGYHGWSGQYAFAYVPWSPTECRRGLEPWGAMQVTASHEWAEAATDPIPLPDYWGWTISEVQGEIADLCNTGTAAEHAEAASGTFVAKLADDYLWAANDTPCVAHDVSPIRYQINTGPTSVGVRQATLTGSVNPAGWPAKYQFSVIGPEGTTYIPPRTQNPPSGYGFAPLGEGFGNVPLSAEVTNLKPNTTYTVRLESLGALTEPIIITEWGIPKIMSGGETKFTTPYWRPVVSSEHVSNGTTQGATLNASINPMESPTHYTFEYGLNAVYGSKAPVPDQDIGSGGAPVPISQPITNLRPESVYHYRVVATNQEGTTYGSDRQFATKAQPATFTSAFGSTGTGNGQLDAPIGTAVDGSGNLWIVDSKNNRVQKFNAKGEYLSQFGSTGTGNGQFKKPVDIAISPKGELFVTDAENNRVQRFSASGEYLAQFGTKGTGYNQFTEPWGIGFGPNEKIWVSDRGYQRVLVYVWPSELSWPPSQIGAIGDFAHQGFGQTSLSEPTDIAFDAQGDGWVLDSGNNLVKEFGSTLSSPPTTVFGSEGSGEGQFKAPMAIAFKPGGTMLIVDKGNDRVQQFGLDGEYLGQFGTLGSGNGQFSEPSGVAIAPNGNEYVADTGNDRVQKWNQPWVPEALTQAASDIKEREATLNGAINPSGGATTYRFEYGTSTSYGKGAPAPAKDAGSGTETIAVSEPVGGLAPLTTYHYRLVASNGVETTYGEDRSFKTKAATVAFTSAFGSTGTGNGQLDAPIGTAVDGSGNLWIVDSKNNRVQKFNAKGEYLSQFGSTGTGNGQFKKPVDIAISPKGELFVTDAENNRVQRFSASGEYLAQFGTKGTGYNQFTEPWGIGFGPNEKIWVSDRGYQRVLVYVWPSELSWPPSQIGAIGDFAHQGFGQTSLSEPTDIAFDAQGDGWVLDSGNNLVKEFGSTLSSPPTTVFGSEGSGEGQFKAPMAIAFKPGGTMLIVDKGNDRVQQFNPSGEYLGKFGTAGSGSGQLSEPQGIAIGSGDTVFVADTGNDRVQKWCGPAAPKASTKAASAITASQATLAGTVNSGCLPTTYRFDYGTSASYEQSVPVPGKETAAATEDIQASELLGGLAPATTYHFRLVATNAEGTAYGEDKTFETGASGMAGQLAAMAITQPFSGSAASQNQFSVNFSALGWASGTPAKGEDTSSGWRPVPAYPTVNGAYLDPTLTDTGPGIAAVATMATNPSIASRYFSLWLDMPNPAGARAGYELRFTNVAANTYDVTLSRWEGGSQSTLASQSGYSFANGNSFALVDKGATVSAWTNTGSGFNQLLGAADATFSSGSAGIEGAGNITRLANFKAGALLTPVNDMDEALGELALNDAFATAENPLSGGGAWAALSWASHTGRVSGGWGPYNAYPTVNGAHWQEASFSDTGAGVATAATLYGNPTIASRYFSLWLDMPSPTGAQSGYELRFTETSSSVYEVALSKWQAGTKTVLASQVGYSFPTKSRFALVDKGGTVSAWTATGSEYTQLLSGEDTAFNSGYTGIEGAGNITRLTDFRSGPLAPF